MLMGAAESVKSNLVFPFSLASLCASFAVPFAVTSSVLTGAFHPPAPLSFFRKKPNLDCDEQR